MLTLGRIAAALLSGALLAQAYGLTPFWPLAWIAPIPVLIAAIGASRLGAFLYGALAGALSMALMVTYFLRLGGPAPVIIVTLVKALIWGGMMFAVGGAARHIPAWAAVFVFPTLLAGIETLIAATSPHGSAAAFAYGQMDFLPVIQLASLGGAPAITFIVCLFASLVAFPIAKRAVVAAMAPALIVVAALGWGFNRSLAGEIGTSANPHPTDVRVAALAGDDLDSEAADWRPTWERYVFEVDRAAQDGSRLIVLPEKIARLGDDQVQEALAPLSAIAREHEATIVVGAVAQEGGASFNRAYLITPEAVRAYDKRYMIPGLESEFTPGTEILVSDINGVRIGVAICKDFDFPNLLRRYAAAEVAIMLAPAWDFEVDGWLHGRMAILRGVEGGFFLIRSPREGLMTISDPYGRVDAEIDTVGDVTPLRNYMRRPEHVPTLYTRIGDAFGWACGVLALLLIGWTIVARRRAGQGA